MPWKASSVMEERLRFVARLLDGEPMTDVCRDFGVSHKTGNSRSKAVKARSSPVCMHRKKINISTVLAGQTVGIKGRRRHLARQLHALRSGIYRPGTEDPAAPRQPVRPEVVTPCLRYNLSPMSPGRTAENLVPRGGIEPPTP